MLAKPLALCQQLTPLIIINGKAYGVSASCLLLGEASEGAAIVKRQPSKNSVKGCTLKNCPERIQAYALLLKDEPQNIAYV